VSHLPFRSLPGSRCPSHLANSMTGIHLLLQTIAHKDRAALHVYTAAVSHLLRQSLPASHCRRHPPAHCQPSHLCTAYKSTLGNYTGALQGTLQQALPAFHLPAQQWSPSNVLKRHKQHERQLRFNLGAQHGGLGTDVKAADCAGAPQKPATAQNTRSSCISFTCGCLPACARMLALPAPCA
jgi:hypothetical protein